MPKITITIEADIDDLEAECFRNNMDEESLDGQADIVKDIMRLAGNPQPKIWWKVEQPKGFSYIQKIWKEKVCTERHYTNDVLQKEIVTQEGNLPLIRDYTQGEVK